MPTTRDRFLRAAMQHRIRCVEPDHTVESDFDRLSSGECGTIALTPAALNESVFCVLFITYEQIPQRFRFTVSCDFTGDLDQCGYRIFGSSRAVDFASYFAGPGLLEQAS